MRIPAFILILAFLIHFTTCANAASVYIATNSRTYHCDRNCPELNTDNVIEFNSPEEADALGAIPCGHCKLTTGKLNYNVKNVLPNPVITNGSLGEFRHGTFPSPPLGEFTHVGVDLVAPCGSDVYSFADGRVKDVIDNTNDKDYKTLGYMVLIEHPVSLIGKKFYTLYLHMQGPPEVKIGNQVTGGSTVIGKVGDTGKAFGCHTHFEIRYFPERFSTWGNIYGPGDQRASEYFKQNWENPLTFFKKYPDGLKIVKSGEGENNRVKVETNKDNQEKQTTIYFTKGHGERDFGDFERAGLGNLANSIKRANYNIIPLDLLEKKRVPENCDILFIAGPTKAFSTEETNYIRNYIGTSARLLDEKSELKEGKLLVMLEPVVGANKPSGLKALLGEYGIIVRDDAVVYNKVNMPNYGMQTVVEIYISDDKYLEHEITKDIKKLTTVFYGSCVISPAPLNDTMAFSAKTIVQAPDSSWGETEITGKKKASFDKDVDVASPISLAVAVEFDIPKAFADKSQRGGHIVVFGDTDFAANAFSDNPGNQDIVLKTISWLTDGGILCEHSNPSAYNRKKENNQERQRRESRRDTQTEADSSEGVYVGDLKDGVRHGQGTVTYSNGDKYVGQWKDGKKHGQGTYISSNDDKYVGEWKNDKRNGQGTFTLPEGTKYVGEWKNGRMHGQGTLTYSNGDKYVGEWKEVKMHGQGTYTWSNGDKYVGEFKDGKRHGQGTYTYADGNKYVGEWKDGNKYDSSLDKLDWAKWLGSERENLKPLDKEAFGFANTIINQHWLIVEKSRKDDNYDNSWFTTTDNLSVDGGIWFIQMKDVIYKVEIQEVNEVDKMNGIEWKGYFYIYPKFTRTTNLTNSNDPLAWNEWYDGGTILKRNYRYEIWKTGDKWIFKDILEGCRDSSSGWCLPSRNLKKPKIEELPDFTGSGKLKENYNTKEHEYASYYKHMKDKIRLYWLLQYGTDTSVNQVTNEDKPVIVTFKVLPSGQIVNVKVVDAAGNDLLASKIKESIQNTKLDKFPDYIHDNNLNVRFNWIME